MSTQGPVPPGASQRPGQQPMGLWHPVQQPPPPRNEKGRALLVAGAVVVALALVVGGGIGVYYGFVKRMAPTAIDPIDLPNVGREPAEDWKPGPGAVMTGKVAWSDTYIENDPFDAHPAGYWLTDTLFIRGSHTRLVAYQRKTGQKVWELDAPPNRKFCGMTTTTDNRTGAMAVDVQTDKRSAITKQPQRLCKDVQLVDLTSGKARWTTAFPRKSTSLEATNAIVELDGSVVIFHSDNETYGVAIATGKKLWTTQAMKRGDEACKALDIVSAPKRGTFLSLWRCGSFDQPSLSTATIAPATGKLGTAVELPKDDFKPDWSVTAGFASAEPAVVVLPPPFDQQGKGSIAVLDESGRRTASIPQSGAYGLLDLFDTTQSGKGDVPQAARPRYAMSVVGETLYAVTARKDISQPLEENSVVAFDLATGKSRWTAKAGDSTTVKLVGADENGATAMSVGSYQTPPQPLRFAAADGTRTELGPPYARDYIAVPMLSLMAWADQQVIMMPWRELPSVVGAPPPPAVFAFG